jgi:SPP1 family predicted phage head-tail adaptor
MAGAMHAGRLRHRVEIQGYQETRNAYGQAVRTWVTEGYRWACIEPMTGREYWQAQQVQAQTSHTVTLRYYAGMTAEKRLVLTDAGQTRIFNVDRVLRVDEVRHWMTLTCRENLGGI